MTDDAVERLKIRELVENWAVWRDAATWDRFRTVWHPEGRMMATWFQGSYEDFIRVSQEGWDRGVRILHFLGGSSIDVAGTRAIAQTKMTIAQRAPVDGVPCDVVCTGRFYDFLEQARRPLGPCSSATDLREGPARSGRPGGSPQPRQGAAARNFPKATGTSPTCRPASAMRSSATCRASTGRRSKRSTLAARAGSGARRCRGVHNPRHPEVLGAERAEPRRTHVLLEHPSRPCFARALRMTVIIGYRRN